MSMSLKYSTTITAISNCPPSGCKAVEMTAYRFVHADTAHPNNFLPPRFIDPTREFSGSSRECGACALSFYTTQDKAEAAFRSLMKTHQKIANTIGVHLAVGRIDPADGIASQPGKRGHFDLFEANGANLALKFQTLGPILK